MQPLLYQSLLLCAVLLLLHFPAALSSLSSHDAFLSRTSSEPGIKTTPSGLMYKVLKSSTSTSPLPAPVSPPPAAVVSVRYTGLLPSSSPSSDGSYPLREFTSSGGQEHVFITTDLVQGWQEGLRLMRLGDEFELTLPHTLAYGPQGAGGVIPAFSAIVFRMELTGFDEIGGGALDLWVWKGVVLMQRNLWGPVRVWYAVVHHILTRTLKECDACQQKLNSGSTFAQVAKANSICDSASSNGYLGSYESGTCILAFEKVMWKAKIGEVVGPIKSDFGWHLLMITSRGVVVDDKKGAPEGKKTKGE
ncbi:hypothetical protein TeGR_g6135 [Tetraparma gracilis]|uniref:peptidylprolyl isomerase n=1 Tax=Tetraparma gracilis TaxID=2962635 RepID=A0ABQ6M4F3_9STRA|nr:hypothetical protein TeGR_g6135 [Tetraparma gracilis]